MMHCGLHAVLATASTIPINLDDNKHVLDYYLVILVNATLFLHFQMQLCNCPCICFVYSSLNSKQVIFLMACYAINRVGEVTLSKFQVILQYFAHIAKKANATFGSSYALSYIFIIMEYLFCVTFWVNKHWPIQHMAHKPIFCWL